MAVKWGECRSSVCSSKCIQFATITYHRYKGYNIWFQELIISFLWSCSLSVLQELTQSFIYLTTCGLDLRTVGVCLPITTLALLMHVQTRPVLDVHIQWRQAKLVLNNFGLDLVQCRSISGTVKGEVWRVQIQRIKTECCVAFLKHAGYFN